ncbi:MAG TPA: GNAT family N-acetyltransferase [Bacteroidia bacterium]|nr:GNAT family N-acetyltransferase [Bacteroidia bacterium]
MKIRPGTLSDVEPLLKIINKAYEVESFFIDGDRITKSGLEQRFDTGAFLVSEENSAINGCIYFEIRKDRGYFGLLAVKTDQQGKGLGSRLISEVETYCLNAQCRFMDIQVVNLRTELLAYYKRLGYEETGTAPYEKADISKIPCHFLILSKPLVANV